MGILQPTSHSLLYFFDDADSIYHRDPVDCTPDCGQRERRRKTTDPIRGHYDPQQWRLDESVILPHTLEVAPLQGRLVFCIMEQICRRRGITAVKAGRGIAAVIAKGKQPNDSDQRV